MQPVTFGRRIVLAAALLGACVTPAPAKPPVPTCSARFAASQVAGAGSGVSAAMLDAVAIDPAGITVSTTCGSVVSRPRRTRKGWKVRARWRPCGGARKVALAATIDSACQALRGVLKTRKPRRRIELRVNATVPCTQSAAFESTFQGIQSVIFERHGCTAQACHGGARQGGLDLSPAVAYRSLFQARSTASPFNRVEPGDQRRSFLWLKLAAATDPSQLPAGVQVAGTPMPSGRPALEKDELELIRLWIYSGAPETGTVGGTEGLLNACLPAPQPIIIEPLAPPPPGEGVQFVMPPWPLPAHSESELCFATYYDVSAQVPKEFQDPSGTLFRFSGLELRQDPQSHHLILNRYFGAGDVHDPAFGRWTCAGGERAGAACEPTDLASCGSGICRSEIRTSFACIGFGPPGAFSSIGGAQKAQASIDYVDGAFAQVPMKGILYWNSHAFNLTGDDTTMHARLNYRFARSQRYPIQPIFNIERIFAADAAPYTTQTVCHAQQLPPGARLFQLSSHTHKRGKEFTITGPDGGVLYQNFVYNDPADLIFDPPLRFDSPDPAKRVLEYCALYNNGVALDGSPDPENVTRASRVPPQGYPCSPRACAAGKIGAACGTDRQCDSLPGARDGWCDACPITGGESTENEMFILIGSYYVEPAAGTAAALPSGATTASAAAAGRSTLTDVVLPPQVACSASQAGHAQHARHAGHAPGTRRE
jgi:hypothetical protein